MKANCVVLRVTLCTLILLSLILSPCAAQTSLSPQPHQPEAQVHREQGSQLWADSRYADALQEYQAAYDLDKGIVAYREDAADDLQAMGDISKDLDQYSQAIGYYQKALSLYQQVKDTDGLANDLCALGIASRYLGQYDKAVAYHQQALPLFQQAKDQNGQSKNLTNLGNAYDALRQYPRAIAYYRQALALSQAIHNQNAQAGNLTNLGNVYTDLSHYEKAISYYQQALPLFQQVNDINGQAGDLNNLGRVYDYMSQYDKAISYYQLALPFYHSANDIHGQARDLMNLGIAYDDLSQYEKAIGYFQQALPLYQQTKDQDGEAKDLNNLGNAYADLSQYDKAIPYYQQALPLYELTQNQDGQAGTLTNLGTVSEDLGQYDTAFQFFQLALPLFQKAKDINGQAGDLTNLGTASAALGQYQKALHDHQQALILDRQVHDLTGQARDLNNLGITYADLGQYQKAIGYYHQALPLYRKVGDQDGEAKALTNLGLAYDGLKQDDKALPVLQQALSIFQQTKDRDWQASDLNAFMTVWSHKAIPSLAIFYGKQAVNVYQSIRQDIQTMDQQTQKTYLKDKEATYRQLAELLIKQGRLPEAEQVLNLLKDQEFFDYLQHDSRSAPTAGEATLTPVETTWQERYQVIADRITAIGQTKQDLLTKQQQADHGQITLTAPEKADLQKNLAQADADLTVANKAFQGFLKQLTDEFQDAPKHDQDRVQTLTDATAFEDTLSQLGPGTIALYTIIEPTKVRILVVTSQTQVAREYAISETSLRAKVLAFRQVLEDPAHDPRPLAQALYKIFIGPIARDLAEAHATTLMWSLDDVLRYLPMAALYDGKQYLVERYQNEVFTPASESRLTEAPQAQWSGLGLGVSQAYPGFQALTGVPQELDDVIDDPAVRGSSAGALPGMILLNTAFTRQAMTQALEERKYPLVHIASHFDFQPGDESASFLLLGDGSHLSLADIKTLPQIFQGVDLLTLSACDTANGSTAGADGHEVEGFAVLAQRLGAKAVIASLWPVADASTPQLMETFYRDRASSPSQTKAEALRLAQLSLLHGTASVSADSMQRAQIVPNKSVKSASDAPPFMPDPKAPFAHPYYWAPFILIGNWK